MMDRVYRGKNKRVGWVYGSHIRHEARQLCPMGSDKLSTDEIEHYIARDSFADWNMPRSIEIIPVDPDTVGQFIGLDDKNENPIFEDDIVKQAVQYPGSEPKVLIGVVKEDFCNPCFVIDDGKYPEFDFVKCGYATLEVLGNVHDNPELLEELK